MNRSESKYHNTALKMHDALITLLERKDFVNITIIELCAEAKVNRSTFYAHYQNTYDLLKEVFNEKVSVFFDSYNQSLSDIEDSAPKASILISPQYLIPYLRFIRDNKKFFSVYIEHSQNFDSDSTYNLLLDKVFSRFFKKSGITNMSVINYMSKFYLQGITAIVAEWVRGNCEDDESFICETIIMCIRPS